MNSRIMLCYKHQLRFFFFFYQILYFSTLQLCQWRAFLSKTRTVGLTIKEMVKHIGWDVNWPEVEARFTPNMPCGLGQVNLCKHLFLPLSNRNNKVIIRKKKKWACSCTKCKLLLLLWLLFPQSAVSALLPQISLLPSKNLFHLLSLNFFFRDDNFIC